MGISYKQSLINRFENFGERAISFLDKSNIEPSLNEGSSPLVFIPPFYPWGKLCPSMRRMQNEIYNEYKNLVDMGSNLIGKSLPDNKEKYEQESERIFRMIEQTTSAECTTIEEAKIIFKEAINVQIEMINSVHGQLGEGKILVPDTNVFINDPNFHEYNVSEKCGLLLLPTVLSELDKLKTYHRDKGVKNNAISAIKNIKNCCSKGSCQNGVKINDKITVFTIAIEPQFENKPKWLSSDNNDDRFLASCFEAVSNFPDSEIIIITSDSNMQNKAAFAKFLFLDPGEEKLLNI